MPGRRAKDLKITSIVATPVRVPYQAGRGPVAFRDSLAGSGPAVKYILRGGTNKGWVGLGETCDEPDLDHLHRNARQLVDIDFDILQVNRLPIPMDREYDAFELMVYDILGHELKVPAYQLLGDACRDRVACCHVVTSPPGQTTTPTMAVSQVRDAQRHGYDTTALLSRDGSFLRETCQAIHDACGRTMKLLITPDRPWPDVSAAMSALEGLKAFPILAVEGALADSDHVGWQELRQSMGLPLSLKVRAEGESARRSGAVALDAVKHDICDGLAVGQAMASFVRLADLAELAGLACRHGGEGDLGILEAGYVHAAVASPACVWPSHIFGRHLREHDLLKTPLVFTGKYVAVPHKPGLGVILDIHAMEKYRAGEDIILSA